ncbi:MAG: hypothetical protein ACU83V_06435 [Gammaproteobacteria bacterium]
MKNRIAELIRKAAGAETVVRIGVMQRPGLCGDCLPAPGNRHAGQR